MAQQTVRDLFSTEREAWIRDAQSAARKLLEIRESITIDDILKICPRPSYFHTSITGKVLTRKQFKHLGYTLSRNPKANRRVIGVWGSLNAVPTKPKRVGDYDSD